LTLLDSSVRIIALNALQKLVAHVLLKGGTEGDEKKKDEFFALRQVPISFFVVLLLFAV
jgi:hypothetical protein